MAVGYVDTSGTGYIDTPVVSVTGDLELIGVFAIDTVDSLDGIINALNANTGYRLLSWSDGDVQFGWGSGAATHFVGSTGAGTVPSATQIWLRATLVESTGAWAIYTSLDPPETAVGSVSWTLENSGTFGATTVADSTASTTGLGTRDGINAWAGQWYKAFIYDGGVEVANPDFTIADQTSDGGLTFVDDHANTWTLRGDATWVEPVAAFDIIKVVTE